MIYEWKGGLKTWNGVKADDAARQLERIRLFHHALTTELIVEDSKRPDAALNPMFEWDNVEAGYLYRLEQARDVLRHLVVVREDQTDHSVPMRAFVHIEPEPEHEEEEVARADKFHQRKGRFERIDVAMADPDMRQQVLQRAWREVTSWRDRYNEYQEFARICAVIDEEKEQIAS